MSDVDNGDVLRIGCSWVYNLTDEVTNVYHVLVTSGGAKDFADVIDDIQQYADLMYSDILARLKNNLRVDRISVANVTQNLVFGSINWDVTSAGGEAADALPSGVCLLAWGRTLKPRVQIRKYFGVFSEADMLAGVWSGGAISDAFDAMTKHITSQAMTDGLTVTGVAWNRTLETYTLATGVATADEPTYQRRRRRGRGS